MLKCRFRLHFVSFEDDLQGVNPKFIPKFVLVFHSGREYVGVIYGRTLCDITSQCCSVTPVPRGGGATAGASTDVSRGGNAAAVGFLRIQCIDRPVPLKNRRGRVPPTQVKERTFFRRIMLFISHNKWISRTKNSAIW